MCRQFVTVAWLCLMVLACEQSPDPVQQTVNIITDSPTATLAHHFTAAGKRAAVVLSPLHGYPVAGFAQPWLLRIVDEQGLPVNNAMVEITFAAPVALPPDPLFVSPADHQDDGFYRIERLAFAQAGRWYLDMKLEWQTAEEVRQADHVQLSMDVAGPKR